MSTPRYYCSACKLAVIVIGDQKFVACKCGSPIVAEAASALKGAGGVRA